MPNFTVTLRPTVAPSAGSIRETLAPAGAGVRVFLDGRRIDPDADDVGHDRRIVRNVSVITQQELQCVLSCGERDLGLGLTSAEMNVVEIARDRLIERW